MYYTMLYHTVLPEIGVVLVKADPWPLGPLLSWVMLESYNHKELHSLSVLWPMQQPVVMQAHWGIYLPGKGVSLRALSVNTGLAITAALG
jgi:hypothetical protein